ncbi:hypothetical protein GCM10011428_75990 [Streptomyces violaceus]
MLPAAGCVKQGSGWGPGEQEDDLVDLLDGTVREGPEQVLAFCGEERRGVFLVVDQEDRVAGEVGEVGVDRDAAAPADRAAGEVEEAGGGSAARALTFRFSAETSMPKWRSVRAAASAIQGTSRASVFHQRASAPPGRRTRRASGTARAGSVQCQAWA